MGRLRERRNAPQSTENVEDAKKFCPGVKAIAPTTGKCIFPAARSRVACRAVSSAVVLRKATADRTEDGAESNAWLETLHILELVQVAVKGGDGDVFFGPARGKKSIRKSRIGSADAFQGGKHLRAIPYFQTGLAQEHEEFFDRLLAFHAVKGEQGINGLGDDDRGHVEQNFSRSRLGEELLCGLRLPYRLAG